MSSRLDNLKFLARSEYRGIVLQLLAEEPYTRGELSSATDASQPTLGRTLEELEARHWIERDDHRYEATPIGIIVAEAFTTLCETLTTEQNLRSITPLLPLETMDFPFVCLTDATVTTPTRADPSAPMRRGLSLLDRTTHVRSLSYSFVAQALSRIVETITNGEGTFEGITTHRAVNAMDPADARAVHTTEHGQLHIHDDIPPKLGMAITDRSVYFLVRDEHAVLRALLETDDETVRTWAEETFERYKCEAEPVNTS